MGGSNERSAVLKDTERMRDVLSRHLRWGDGGEVEVRSCDLAYFHETTSRCLLHYDLTVRDPETGRDRRELVTGFVSGEARAEQVARQIARVAPAATADRLVSVVPIPDLDLVLQVFPFDQRLPALQRLMTTSAPLVESTIVADLGPGDWQATGWSAEAIRYRIDQRAMVRITVAARDGLSGTTVEHAVYAKIFREGADGARAFAVQQALWRRGVSHPEAFAVARPIAYLETAQTLLMEEVSGANLRQVLGADTPSTEIRRVARAVADLHQISPDEVAFADRRRPARDEATRLDKIAATLRTDVPAASAEIDALVAAIGEETGASPVGLTHFDLKPGHILLNPDRVTLLDFDKLALADPLVDVANFLVFLGKERSDRSDDGGEFDHVHHFVDEYLTHVPAEWRAMLPSRYALALLAEATGNRGLRGREQRSDRGMKVEALIGRARRALDGDY